MEWNDDIKIDLKELEDLHVDSSVPV
jgi:hypothetical protein